MWIGPCRIKMMVDQNKSVPSLDDFYPSEDDENNSEIENMCKSIEKYVTEAIYTIKRKHEKEKLRIAHALETMSSERDELRQKYGEMEIHMGALDDKHRSEETAMQERLEKLTTERNTWREKHDQKTQELSLMAAEREELRRRLVHIDRKYRALQHQLNQARAETNDIYNRMSQTQHYSRRAPINSNTSNHSERLVERAVPLSSVKMFDTSKRKRRVDVSNPNKEATNLSTIEKVPQFLEALKIASLHQSPSPAKSGKVVMSDLAKDDDSSADASTNLRALLDAILVLKERGGKEGSASRNSKLRIKWAAEVVRGQLLGDGQLVEPLLAYIAVTEAKSIIGSSRAPDYKDGHVILKNKFSWSKYPVLETMLLTQDGIQLYYRYRSLGDVDSRRRFYRSLIHRIRDTVQSQNWILADDITDRFILSAVRKYFSDKLESSKAKLKTVLGSPTKEKHILLLSNYMAFVEPQVKSALDRKKKDTKCQSDDQKELRKPSLTDKTASPIKIAVKESTEIPRRFGTVKSLYGIRRKQLL